MTNEVPGTEYYSADETDLVQINQELYDDLVSISSYYTFLVYKGLLINGATKEEINHWTAEYNDTSDEELIDLFNIEGLITLEGETNAVWKKDL